MPYIEDALNRARWRVGIGEIAVRVGYIWPPSFTGINPDQNWIDLSNYSCPGHKADTSQGLAFISIYHCSRKCVCKLGRHGNEAT